MKIYIGADHRGYELKNWLGDYLLELEFAIEDVGAYEYDKNDDYTHFAKKVAQLVAKDTQSRGILLCGSGVGMDIAANKFDGVRASLGINAVQIAAGRKDDDMNVLVIAADYTEFAQVKEIAEAFLKTEYDGQDRHQRRLQDIREIEADN